MNNFKIILLGFLLIGLFLISPLRAQNDGQIFLGNAQIDRYLPLLKGKRVACVVNQTSCIGRTHLVDSLLRLKVNIVKIFAPEHGFRGEADAGEKIQNGKDPQTGLQVMSLYGENKTPQAKDLNDIDILVFDIQDVGARFYTYISTLHYLLKASGDFNIPVLVLDRPNPNGHYVDGPVLEMPHQSFVGIAPIPVVHGLTIGEFAKMSIGQEWIKSKHKPKITIIPCKNYTHATPYAPEIRPSPNLPNYKSILLYPTLCFLEGTPLSVGRGTDLPFQMVGHPNLTRSDTSILIRSLSGAKNPPLLGQKIPAITFRNTDAKSSNFHQIDLDLLLDLYRQWKDKDERFFLKNGFWTKLAGTLTLQKDMEAGKTAEQIRASWQPGLKKYAKMRKKYLLYK
ncbi:MAG: DUF1343 domain-containing protein [Saprospiraceae bacterium]|jgi:uncharacterized protein YbbC (DUF1343 family)|nr:DUF1343 domain-containing protein [Saprospiraceae bacterium]